MKPDGTKRAKDGEVRDGEVSAARHGSVDDRSENSAPRREQAYGQFLCSDEVHSGRSVLTWKELQLLELLSYGYENGDIADHFQTSLQAVKNMLRTINLKLGADNRTHAVSICFRNEWLPLTTETSAAKEPTLPAKPRSRQQS
jgi:DNA-binding NarL/FixJ family response regulator